MWLKQAKTWTVRALQGPPTPTAPLSAAEPRQANLSPGQVRHEALEPITGPVALSPCHLNLVACRLVPCRRHHRPLVSVSGRCRGDAMAGSKIGLGGESELSAAAYLCNIDPNNLEPFAAQMRTHEVRTTAHTIASPRHLPWQPSRAVDEHVMMIGHPSITSTGFYRGAGRHADHSGGFFDVSAPCPSVDRTLVSSGTRDCLSGRGNRHCGFMPVRRHGAIHS